ncbi:MAG: WecB/TagA/CpsF family glycosyltransferase, partial [Actinomycetota bacterium]
LTTKVSGSDLFVPLLRAAAARDVPVFLLGSTADNAAVAVRRLRTEIPALRIVGYASPWFDPSLPVDEQPELRAAIGQLHASGARLVVLGFGSPKQELLLERLRPALPNGAYCNLGASIDFVAGSQVRSPAWMSRVGLEWLFRLLSDPRRLWRRYLVDDVRAAPVFARLAIARVRRRPVTSWVPR